jgi:HEAT repeat protein
MPEAIPLSPELSRSVSALSRALVAAARSWALYPPDHPSVRGSLDRLTTVVRDACGGRVFSVGVTPDTLLVDGSPAGDAGPIPEAAAWLHSRDVLRLTFAGQVNASSLERLLALFSDDPGAVRQRGGPATCWQESGDPSIAIEQIDFSRVLADREVEHPARRKDDLWRAIVHAVTARQKILDDAIQKRLLEIAGDVVAIGNLAEDVMAPNRAADGSPMLTSQAAAVVAAYRHLVGIVDVMAPERRTEVMQNLAAATAALDPRVILQMLGGGGDTPGGGAHGGAEDIRRGLADAFDDMKVAQLLATTLAIDGQASDRLAEVFDTIAPDEPRKRRVLTLARSLLSETSFGRTTQFQNLWTSMEELLLSYNEKPFVSADYKIGLDQAGARAQAMAAELPDDLRDLIGTLEQDNVRRLSIVLLIDLLNLERDASRATDIARDLAALCEDLLLAGDYDGAVMVTRSLADHAVAPKDPAGPGAAHALDALPQTPAFVEAADMYGGMSEDEASRFAVVCAQIGPAAADVLRRLLEVEDETPARRRATGVLLGYGARAVARLAPMVGHPQWYVRRNAAELLGAIASPQAVPLLQPLLRGGDPRVTQAAVRALAAIDDPAAARAVHTVLRAAAGPQRQAVVSALVAERDPRVVPVLVRILNESEPFGADHAIVLETLGAIGIIGCDEAVPHVAEAMRRRNWLARKKVRALKQGSLEALRAIGSPAAQAAIADAAARGDRLLRKLARNVGAVPHA